jgi:hypothetical protein
LVYQCMIQSARPREGGDPAATSILDSRLHGNERRGIESRLV